MDTFDDAKRSLLLSLMAGHDYSPKGSIDAPVLELVHFINQHLPDYVTTSSCSGRISVYQETQTKGIHWLLVVHGTVTAAMVQQAVAAQRQPQPDTALGPALVALKCEGFILHVHCRDVESGRFMHQVAMASGFRESGLSIGQKKVQLAVRTTAYGLELPVAVGDQMLLDTTALDIVVSEANRRLLANFARTDRLLSALKRAFAWPTLRLLPSPGRAGGNSGEAGDGHGSTARVQRWGHCCAVWADLQQRVWVLGGYGVDGFAGPAPGSSSGVSSSSGGTRKLRDVELGVGVDQTLGAATAFDIAGDAEHAVHAEAVALPPGRGGRRFLLLSGGRGSPQQPLPCLRLYECPTGGTPIAVQVEETGDVPSPRWGHTLTSLPDPAHDGDHDAWSVFLFGGRDDRRLHGDAYILTITVTVPVPSSTSPTASGIKCHWRRAGGGTDVPTARCFHAACAVGLTHDHDAAVSASPTAAAAAAAAAVVVHGGLLSLEAPESCSRAFAYYPPSDRWAAFDSYGSDVAPATAETEGTVLEDSVGAEKREGGGSGWPRRFGHTLSALGAKTLFISGGTAFENVGDGEGDAGSAELVAVDVQSRDGGALVGVPRTLVPEPGAFPCRDCRAHHRAVYCPPPDPTPAGAPRTKGLAPTAAHRGVLHLVGGGLPCMSFGAHYCAPVSFAVVAGAGPPSGGMALQRRPAKSVPQPRDFAASPPVADARASGVGGASDDAGNDDEGTDGGNGFVVLVPQRRVKAVKSFFEGGGRRWLDKARRIAGAESVEAGAGALEVRVCLASWAGACGPADVAAYDAVQARAAKAKNPKAAKAASVAERTTETAAAVAALAADPASHVPEPVMAVPVATPLALALLRLDPAAGAHVHGTEEGAAADVRPEQLRELLLCLGAPADGSVVVARPRGPARPSKALAASGQRRAWAFLEAFARAHGVLARADGDLGRVRATFPRKFEHVGDVLMVPEGALDGPLWGPVLAVDSEATAAAALWPGLLACFGSGCRRAARKAPVDAGGMRESLVRLLWPPLGRPTDTGPCSAGWVTVVENGVAFGFDVTRVMFCSGNCTERMRMAREAAAGQTVVDLYCGVGYYTLPFLVHAHAAHVHACEWNPNSVLALRDNLRRAGPDVAARCTVHAGDNRVTVADDARGLRNVAHRVCLGLLPSSVAGWPLAARCLRPEGGLLHVHENVHEDDVDAWAERARGTFEGLLQAEGKALAVHVRHIERVKSYAPRVLHIVVDMVCS